MRLLQLFSDGQVFCSVRVGYFFLEPPSTFGRDRQLLEENRVSVLGLDVGFRQFVRQTLVGLLESFAEALVALDACVGDFTYFA